MMAVSNGNVRSFSTLSMTSPSRELVSIRWLGRRFGTQAEAALCKFILRCRIVLLCCKSEGNGLVRP